VERLARETAASPSWWKPTSGRSADSAASTTPLPLLAVVARRRRTELGETDRALDTNRKILALRPDDAEAVDALERLYLAKERFADLLAIYDKKLSLPGDPAAQKQIRYKSGSSTKTRSTTTTRPSPRTGPSSRRHPTAGRACGAGPQSTSAGSSGMTWPTSSGASWCWSPAATRPDGAPGSGWGRSGRRNLGDVPGAIAAYREPQSLQVASLPEPGCTRRPTTVRQGDSCQANPSGKGAWCPRPRQGEPACGETRPSCRRSSPRVPEARRADTESRERAIPRAT